MTTTPSQKLFCFGLGYSARVLIEHLQETAANQWAFAGTHTRPEPQPAKKRDGDVSIATFSGDGPSAEVRTHLRDATHVLISIPPDLEGDPALRHHGIDLAQLPSLQWIGYLSTIGVYGDAAGGWVDETTPARPSSERALRRALAETQWRSFGTTHGKRVQVFRLPGIYGPGRSVIDSLRDGTAKRVIKPGQVFNRIHVVDIARVLAAAMQAPAVYSIYNVVDDEPAAPQDVITYAAELLGIRAPAEVAFDAARMSPMAQSFYSENKRVKNDRIKQALGVTLQYPTYREGLLAIVRDT
ncbi:MAG: SDR family oxidoreductase [Hyphomicrobiaceae bacterium]